MIIKRSKVVGCLTSCRKGKSTTRESSELMVVTRNEIGTFAKLSNVLAKNKVTMECFTGYEWGTEAAFRIVTDNNKKALNAITNAGFTATENPVVLWYTDGTPSRVSEATTALAYAGINTYCTYTNTACNAPNKASTVIAFTTNNSTGTSNVLNSLK
jgi:hypothetical protein